jgi:diacylglycerol kinase family enzyme
VIHQRRIFSILALLALAAVTVLAGVLVLVHTLAVVVTIAALATCGACAWLAVTRRNLTRRVAIVGGTAALLGGGIALIVLGALDEFAVIAAFTAVFAFTASRAVRRDSQAPDSARAERARLPTRGVLLLNPKSGGGKVEQFDLVAEARRRRIASIVLEPGDDLQALADEAARSADVVGVAGGDGSQALVADIAMRHGIGYVCVPAGTRNHFALDLGIDRTDVVSALDAFQYGTERRVDLARVNEWVFVNNVSLGIYAEIVQSEEYRDAKLETAAAMLPDLAGPDAPAFDLRFRSPDGDVGGSAQLILVSNNPYVLDRLIGGGTRPRLDTGRLGVVAVQIADGTEAAALVALDVVGLVRRFRGWHEWSVREFKVTSTATVAAAIDGEGVVLASPLRFQILPRALRVLLPPRAAALPSSATGPAVTQSSLRELVAIARGQR